MTVKHHEFVISGVVCEERNRLTLIGRNGDTLIRLDETFDALLRYRRRRSAAEYGEEPVVEVEKPVHLRVVGIRAYERDLDALGQGMTGSIVVEGEGLKSLAPGWVLGERNGTTLPAEAISGSAQV